MGIAIPFVALLPRLLLHSVMAAIYSVQYKGDNLIRVTTVEGGVTRGMTAQVYYSIHSSLYTGTAHWVQGC